MLHNSIGMANLRCDECGSSDTNSYGSWDTPIKILCKKCSDKKNIKLNNKNMNVKQVIVVRKDLNMRKGKLAAQVAHASLKVFLDNSTTFDALSPRDNIRVINFTYPEKSSWDIWLNGQFTKVVVSCDSEQELDELYRKVKYTNIPVSMIVDAGKTEFNGVPTKTCIAIGPFDSNEIDKITGNLKLL